MQVGELKTEQQSVQLWGAKTVKVDLSMGAGELTLVGGASDLLDASFTYNVAEWQPEVQYSVSGQQGTLTIEDGVFRVRHDITSWESAGHSDQSRSCQRCQGSPGSVPAKSTHQDMRAMPTFWTTSRLSSSPCRSSSVEAGDAGGASRKPPRTRMRVNLERKATSLTWPVVMAVSPLKGGSS